MRRQAKVGEKGRRLELFFVMHHFKRRRAKCDAKVASLGDRSVSPGDGRQNWLSKLEILK